MASHPDRVFAPNELELDSERIPEVFESSQSAVSLSGKMSNLPSGREVGWRPPALETCHRSVGWNCLNVDLSRRGGL
jgi:hypothetical protein